jgi:hypothetical protein
MVLGLLFRDVPFENGRTGQTENRRRTVDAAAIVDPLTD